MEISLSGIEAREKHDIEDKTMWTMILVLTGLLSAGAAIYSVFRVHRFSFVKRFGEKHRVLAWLVSFLAVGALGLFALINVFTALIVLLHLFFGFVLCDLGALILRKAAKKDFGYDAQNLAAVLLTAVWLGAGWFLAHHVFVTQYTVETDKALGGDLRIVEIADAHIGITLDGAGFARQMERVQETNPDLVVIVGDFVDDDTDRQDMVDACRALGELETACGVYFVFGNHDAGYFGNRGFSASELRRELAANGVTVLEDESVLIDDRFYIVGRRDRSWRTRLEASALTADLDPSKYVLLLDHQPNDYENEAAAGADLVLSGHTHGGHIFPAGLIGLAAGSNDRVYGLETRGGTTFLVSSGISGWAIPFKTCAKSEFVVIDIRSTVP